MGEAAGRYWYKFSRKKLSVAGLAVIMLVVFAAVFAPLVVPHPDHAGPYVDLIRGSTAPE